MSDRLFFSLAAITALLLIGLALVAPQGLGARSPAPFGRPLGPVESDAPPPKKALRKRLPTDVAPGSLTAPILPPASPGARLGAASPPAPAPALAARP